MWEAAALVPDNEHQERAQTGNVVFTALIMDAAPSIPQHIPPAWSFTTTSAWERQAPWEGGRVQGQHEESLDEAGGLSSSMDLFFICVLLQGCTSMARLRNASAPGFGRVQTFLF